MSGISTRFLPAIFAGSQFKVESIMVRLARPLNYAMFSPNRVVVLSLLCCR